MREFKYIHVIPRESPPPFRSRQLYSPFPAIPEVFSRPLSSSHHSFDFAVSVAMAECFLVSVELENLTEQSDLDLRTLSFLNRVFVRVTPENYPSALSYLQKYFNDFITYCDVTALKSPTDILSLLDNGAVKVSASYSQIKALAENGLKDLGRVILSVDQSTYDRDPEGVVKEIKESLRAVVDTTFVGFHLCGTGADGWQILDLLQKQANPHGDSPSRYMTLAHAEDTWTQFLRAIKAGYVPIVPAGALAIGVEKTPNLIQPHNLIISAIRSDRPDGLFATVVSDEHGICLGLVYSNEKSIETALKLGRGVYHSRSRNKLWIKGDESGDIQELVSIGWDCDADALRFTVRQKGNGECRLPCPFKLDFILTDSRILPLKNLNLFRPLYRALPS